jgi:hypothetical protein
MSLDPDTLRHLVAEQVRDDRHDEAMRLLRAEFIREVGHDTAGWLDTPDGQRVPILQFVRDALEDVDTGNALLVDLLKAAHLSYITSCMASGPIRGGALLSLAGRWAAENVDAQVANMSNPD